MTIPAFARAAVFPAPQVPVDIVRLPVPQTLETGAVLLRTLAAEVCGTDVHLWHGKLSGVPYPLLPGHISVGEVAAVGGEARSVDGQPIAVGQVVTFLDVWGTCYNCPVCLIDKAATRCPHRRVYGITLGADDGLHGGWAEYIHLRPSTKLLPLAANVTPEMWIGGGCGLPTAVHAIERAEIRLGDRVLVQGSGPVGLSVCALARLSGAAWVGVIGAPDARLDVARRFGADFVLNVLEITPGERKRAVQDATGGRGPDIVIEASGNPQAVVEGCELVRDAGRYVVVGQYTDNGTVELNPHTHLNRKHLEVRGCWGSDYSHLWRAMETLSTQARQNGFDWSTLVSRRYSLDNAAEALADVEAARVTKAVILPNG